MCEPLAHVRQTAKLLNLDNLDDILDLISSSKRKGNWEIWEIWNLRKPRRICHSKSNLNLAASRSCREFQTKIDIFLAEIWLSLLSFSMTYSRQKIIPVSECIKSLGFLNLKTRNSAPRPPIDTLLLRTCCMYHSFFSRIPLYNWRENNFTDTIIVLTLAWHHNYVTGVNT